MTAPAVVRRWNDPPPVRVDRSVADRRAGTDLGRHTGGATTRLRHLAREQLVRMWRVAPLGAVLLTGLVAHAAVVPHLAVRGAAPDVLLAAVVAVAVGRGARAGAGFGFAAGLGADVFLTTPLGTSALAYTLIGHVLGGASRPRVSGSAAALCRPGSSCFDCRTGQHDDSGPATEPAARPHRARRRAAARRVALRRSIVLTAVGVGTGRLATALVATILGGVPFLEPAGLVRLAGVAVLSAPLGPLAGAAVRRKSQPSGGRG